jgi:hypothetical protein
MASLTVVTPPEASNTNDVEPVVVRLADEGIPIRAIARACKIPSDEVYVILNAAVVRGTIIELPKDDWPPGSIRTRRAPQQHHVLDDDEKLKFLCSVVFKTTRLQSSIFAVLLKRSEVTKDQLHQVIEQLRDPNRDETDLKMVDVIICHLRRKLASFDIKINTIWGVGYRMDPDDRDRAIRAVQKHEVSDNDNTRGVKAA